MEAILVHQGNANGESNTLRNGCTRSWWAARQSSARYPSQEGERPDHVNPKRTQSPNSIALNSELIVDIRPRREILEAMHLA